MFSIGPSFFAGAAAPATDPHFSKVVLLMHMNNNLLDSSITNASFAASGVTFTTTNAKFGHSANINGTATTGGGSNVVYSSTSYSAWDLNAIDFTIEGWIWMGGVPTRPRTLIRIAGSSDTDEYQIFSDGSQPGNWYYKVPGSSSMSMGVVPEVNKWTHLAVTRFGDVYRAFVNGVLRATFSLSTRAAAGAKHVYIGNSRQGFVDGLYGMVDDVRITAGVARYTSNFAVPTSQFPDRGDTEIVGSATAAAPLSVISQNTASTLLAKDTSILTVPVSVESMNTASTITGNTIATVPVSVIR